MPVDHPLWIEHQRQRWTRHDAHRWLKPTYEPKAKPATEPAPSADFLAAVAEARREHLRMKSMLIDLQIDLFRRQLARKYNVEQPRVPAGNPDGGQWTDGGAASTDISAVRRKALEARCLAQYTSDTFYCTMIGSRPCHAQAAERWAACLARKPIPPLNF